MGGVKRDFALVGHGHELGDLDDVNLTSPADNSLIQYDAASGTWEDVTLASLNAQLDHGTLSGLADDDHPQYGAIAQDETITGRWVHSTGGATLANMTTIGLAEAGDAAYFDVRTKIVRAANIPRLVGARVNGSYGSPSSILSGEAIFSFDGWGYGGSTMRTGAQLQFSAGSAWSGTNSEGYGEIFLTPSGSTTQRKTIGLWSNGGLRLVLDSAEISLGAGASTANNASGDFRLYHNGTNSIIRNDTGELQFLIGASATASIATSGIWNFFGNATAAIFGDGTGAPLIHINGAAGQFRGMLMRTNGATRWGFLENSTAESGSDVGSDFVIRRYNDAGTAIGNSIELTRSNGFLSMPADSVEFRLGLSNDLRLYHDGTNSIVRTDTGGLRLQFSTNNRIECNTTGVGFNGATPIARPDYTITNPTTNRSIDVSGITHANLAQVVGTMIQDLINYGLYQ